MMKRKRDLIVADSVCVLVLIVAFLLGWREAAGFGLGVLAILNLMVLFRGRSGGSRQDRGNGKDDG